MYINSPKEIESKSMDIIEEEMDKTSFTDEEKIVVKRIIHTTGDPSYKEIIKFKEDFVGEFKKAILSGEKIYTDTNMTKAGVNKKALNKNNIEIVSYVSDPDIFEKAKKNGTTRSYAAIEKAIEEGVKVFSVGNAPTALFKLLEEVDKGFKPIGIIGVPVGFVEAKESKDLLYSYNNIPLITTLSTKGGSNVAASIINACLYMVTERD